MSPDFSVTSDSVVCPVLIGREAALESISGALGEAAGGQGGLTLVAGDAGIGKTRLVAEARARAVSDGFLVLQGECFESDRSLPYAAIIDLLNVALLPIVGRERLSSLLRSEAPALGRLLPALGVADRDSSQLGPEEERRRLFDATSHLFRKLSDDRPVLLIVEDLHWSDDASCALLLFLARIVPDMRMAVLATYRPDEVHPALARFLAELDRRRLSREIVLGPLTQEQVGEMLRAMSSGDSRASPTVARSIFAITDGNPFFVEEVLRTVSRQSAERQRMAAVRDDVPRSVQESVRRRVDSLSEGARSLLPLCAVVGRRFDFALIRHLSGLSDEVLLPAIKELVGAAIVVEESADRFAFRHALTREAIHGQLLSRERRAAHQRVLDAIATSRAGEAQVEDLAYHAFEAGEWEQAREFARRAGERALGLYAPAAAVQHFSTAIEAERQLGMDVRTESLLGRARALDLVGDFEAARADFEAGLEAARSAGDTRLEWQIQLELGLLWASRDYDRSGACYEEALALARAAGTPAMVAHSLNRVGNWLVNAEQPFSGARYHAEALRAFESASDDAGIAETCDLLGMANFMGGDLEAGSIYCRRAAVLLEQLQDRRGLASSLSSLLLRAGTFQVNTAVAAASLPDVLAEAGDALSVAQEIEWRSGEAYANWQGSLVLAAAGDYRGGIEKAQRALDISVEIEHRQWAAASHWALGAILLELLAYEQARVELEASLELARETRSGIWLSHSTATLASTLVARGDFSAAAALLDTVQRDETPMEAIGLRLCWAARAELALASGDPEYAHSIATRLVESAPNSSQGDVIPRLFTLRGEARVVLGAEGAEDDLTAAAGKARELGALPMAWRAAAALVVLHRSAGRHTEAARWENEALITIEGLAAGKYDAALQAQFLNRARARLIGGPGTQRRGVARPGGLSPRELEVAIRVARGNSNRAIAEELVLSERTVETHVANILKKLEFSSRAQIAAWAVAHRLEGDST